jgi:hypothetical protein
MMLMLMLARLTRVCGAASDQSSCVFDCIGMNGVKCGIKYDVVERDGRWSRSLILPSVYSMH